MKLIILLASAMMVASLACGRTDTSANDMVKMEVVRHSVTVAPDSWDCPRFFEFRDKPPGVRLYSREVIHFPLSFRGSGTYKWTFSNTPSGGHFHIGDSEENVAWFCGSAGKYEMLLRSEHGGAVKEGRVAFRVP